MKTYKISNQKLRELVLEVESRISFGAIPQTIKVIQNDFIESIPNNDFFTEGEKQALSLYFESYTNFHSKNIQLFESQINEALADWFKTGWEKVKSVFGSIKDYVVKIWGKIKETFKELITKAWAWMKPKIEKAKEKIKEKISEILKGPKKAELVKELGYVGKSYLWLNKVINGNIDFLKSIGDKILGGIESKINDVASKYNLAENIFNKNLTEGLVNSSSLLLEAEDESDFTTKEGWKKNWKSYVWNIVKIILNPVMGTLGVVGGWALDKGLELGSKLIAALGGPGPFKFHVLPEVIMVATELTGVMDSSWNWFKKFIEEKGKLIPGLGTIINFWEMGHHILLAYAVFESIKVAYDEIKGGINQLNLTKESLTESLSPEFIRMQRLAGI